MSVTRRVAAISSLLFEASSCWAACDRFFAIDAIWAPRETQLSESFAPRPSRSSAYRSVSLRSRLRPAICSSRMIEVEQSWETGSRGAKSRTHSLPASCRSTAVYGDSHLMRPYVLDRTILGLEKNV